MGNTVSLLCCQTELARRGEVLVIKEDGEPVMFKDGTYVKDILSAYPYHKVIRCCSQRTVLMSETQLRCNSLYFLLPAGLALSEEAYKRLVQMAIRRNPMVNIPSTTQINVNPYDGNGGGGERQDYMYSDYSYSCKWKPDLMTIPEIATPST